MYVDSEDTDEGSSVSGKTYCSDVSGAMSTVLATGADNIVSRCCCTVPLGEYQSCMSCS